MKRIVVIASSCALIVLAPSVAEAKKPKPLKKADVSAVSACSYAAYLQGVGYGDSIRFDLSDVASTRENLSDSRTAGAAATAELLRKAAAPTATPEEQALAMRRVKKWCAKVEISAPRN